VASVTERRGEDFLSGERGKILEMGNRIMVGPPPFLRHGSRTLFSHMVCMFRFISSSMNLIYS
jgi:hypothetical protein